MFDAITDSQRCALIQWPSEKLLAHPLRLAKLPSPVCADAHAANKNHNKKQHKTMNAFQPLRVETTSAVDTAPALSECVARAVRRYLAHSGPDCAQDLYRLVLAEVEAPMLRETLRHTDGNLTRAAEMLGITRATLRKKLAEHRLG